MVKYISLFTSNYYIYIIIPINFDFSPLSRDQFAEIIEMLIKQDINSILAIEVIKKIIINPNQSVLSVSFF